MKVTQTIQGQIRDDNGNLPEPVEIVFSRDASAVGAVASVASILCNLDDSEWFKTLDIHIEI